MRIRRGTTLAAAVLAGLAIGAALVRRHNGPGLPLLPGPARRQADAEAKLRGVLHRVQFSATPMEKAFQELQAMSGARFNVDWAAIQGSNANLRRDLPVTLSVTDVTLEQALNALVGYRSHALDYTVFDGAIVVTTEANAGDYVYAAVHDLSDVDLVWIDPSYERFVPGASGPGLFPPTTRPPPLSARQEVDEELQRLIETTVAPDSWLVAGGTAGTVRCFGGRVVAVTTWRNHRRIQSIVSELRNASR
jgi:hypothetical protein